MGTRPFLPTTTGCRLGMDFKDFMERLLCMERGSEAYSEIFFARRFPF